MLKLVASKVGKSSRLGDIHDSVTFTTRWYNHVIGCYISPESAIITKECAARIYARLAYQVRYAL